MSLPWPGVAEDPVRFGVNYTPRRGWFHSWLDLDLAEVAEDFAQVAELGLDHVRLFPLWPLLQPNRGLIRGLDDVVAVADLAARAGLDVSVDVLQGHLSSFDFLPAWVSTWHRRNLFTDPDVRAAQVDLVRALAQALRGRRGLTGLTVGNEFVQFAAARHPDPSALTHQQAGDWLATLLGAAQAAWPEGRHVHCFDDDLWFDDTQPFTPHHAVQQGSLTTVHSWIFGGLGRRYGPDAAEASWLARWLCELAAGYGPGRQVWLQEVGAPSSHLSPAAMPPFVTDTIAHLLGGGGGGVTPGLRAITWWCSHDVSRELLDFPELEHTLGLFDTHGRLKPVGRAYAEAIRRWRDQPLSNQPDRRTVTVPVTGWTERSVTAPTADAFDTWVRAAQAGQVHAVRPTLSGRQTPWPTAPYQAAT